MAKPNGYPKHTGTKGPKKLDPKPEEDYVAHAGDVSKRKLHKLQRQIDRNKKS